MWARAITCMADDKRGRERKGIDKRAQRRRRDIERTLEVIDEDEPIPELAEPE